jgi:hypothetical protein
MNDSPSRLASIIRFNVLRQEVGQWSRENFGQQLSKCERYNLPFEETDRHRYIRSAPIALGSLAPFLGVIEECGELAEAVLNNDISLVRDAVGDTLIKRHQGIRKYTNLEFFLNEMRPSLTNLFTCLGRFLYIADNRRILAELPLSVQSETILIVAEQTWQIVRQRNWQANPITGIGQVKS